MTTFSEDVLLQISNVKHKKGEGTLYVMSERIAFILQNSETVSVSHLYTDIKTQKISSEFKTKVQLQLVFHDNTTSTFQFIKSDRIEAMRDRDKVKELLFKLLPKFQKKVNKELEEKNRMLSENPTLLQLYKDLVITQVISSEEFWQQHAPQYIPSKSDNIQNVGVPANFLDHFKPKGDGVVKYNISYETIQCIFKTYPAVRKKHFEYVPHKLSEAEFWKKFFESHYINRDHLNSGTKDIFMECAKYDEQELKKELKTLDNDSLINLNAMQDIDKIEGYGLSNDEVETSNIVHENMIKRCNQHSMMILKASNCSYTKSNTTISKPSNSVPDNNRNSLHNGNHDIVTTTNNNINNKKKQRIADTVVYEDLKLVSESNDKVNETPNLKLKNIENSANDLPNSSKSELESVKLEKANAVREHINSEIQTWSKKNVIFPIQPAAAISALGELTPSNSLMKNLSDDNKSLAHLVPSDITEEFQNLYMATGELLRHFWACFPPTTQNLEEKVIKSHEALRRFHSAKLKPFEDRILREHSQLNQISSHLNVMINAAYDKFSSWHCRRKQHS